MNLRIIAGAAKGRRLFTPPGRSTRPTADRVREALFSVLAPCLADSRVLDAFAGSGALGLEALSRGANFVLFLERNAAALSALKRNIEACGLEGAELRAGDSLRIMKNLAGPFDIIFLDPPYNTDLLEQALNLVLAGGLLAQDGIIVAESAAKNSDFAPPPLLEIFKRGVYGDTVLYYLMLKQ